MICFRGLYGSNIKHPTEYILIALLFTTVQYLCACPCTLHRSASIGNHTQVPGPPPPSLWSPGCPRSHGTRWRPRSSLLSLTAPWHLLIPAAYKTNATASLALVKHWKWRIKWGFPIIFTLINHSNSSRMPFQKTLLVVNKGNWSAKRRKPNRLTANNANAQFRNSKMFCNSYLDLREL